jgi:hypothetical protein
VYDHEAIVARKTRYGCQGRWHSEAPVLLDHMATIALVMKTIGEIANKRAVLTVRPDVFKLEVNRATQPLVDCRD